MDVGDVISGWRIVEDAGTGRSGHVFIVCREGDPDSLFALKMQRTDVPDAVPDANAREAARASPRRGFANALAAATSRRRRGCWGDRSAVRLGSKGIS